MEDYSTCNFAPYKTDSNWDFGNKKLYQLCDRNFDHAEKEVTLAKVLFIGRIYAAAVERRKPPKRKKRLGRPPKIKRKYKRRITNEDFYTEKVLPVFQQLEFQQRLDQLREVSNYGDEYIEQILQLHYFLMKGLKGITNMAKRSFCSKYLHFHLPRLYYLYDTRAVAALSKHLNQVPKDWQPVLQYKEIDEAYTKYYCKCRALTEKIRKDTRVRLKPRQLDNFLIRRQ